MAKTKISFIGAGRVGTALGFLLNNGGYEVIGFASRSIGSAEKAAIFVGNNVAFTNDISVFVEDSDILFITTNDDVIPFVTNELAAKCKIKKGQIFAHVSGSLTSDVFGRLKDRGGLGISIHPLQTIASPIEGVKNIKGSLFAIEGDREALAKAQEMVLSVGGSPFIIDKEKKALYHLAAVIACNYFVTLVDTSLHIFKKIEMDERQGLEGILKLVRGTINNLERLGTKDALTGPIARGDEGTVKDHIIAIKKFTPDILNFYKILASKTVDLAVEKGSIDKNQAKKLKNIIGAD